MEQGIFPTDQGIKSREQGICVSVHFSHTCSTGLGMRSVLTGNFAGEEDVEGGP